MTDSHTVKAYEQSPYLITISWQPETQTLEESFANTPQWELAEMQKRCDAGIDSHFVTTAEVTYRGNLLASESLASCYAENSSPEDQILAGEAEGGAVAALAQSAIDSASQERARMTNQLAQDLIIGNYS